MEQENRKFLSQEELKQLQHEAEQGKAEAQTTLGICYVNGYGVAIDRKRAMKYFGDAAEQGHAEALYQLGICHYYGYGVPSNQSQAAEFWEVAANTGHAEAQYQLGNCYYYGNGVDAHRGRAKHWYAKAGEQGHAEAMYGLSLCCLDEEESFAWCEKAAELGHAEAQFQMGMYYDDDDTWVVQPSYDKARYWYAKAAEHDTIIEAQSCLDALDEAREQMEQWMHEAPQGNPEVLYGLAECYEFGVGTERDYRLAKEYYTRAYEAKEPDDAVEHYFHQRGYKEMMTYLDQLIQVAEWEEMAEEGDTNAMVQLSKYYEYDALYEEELKPKRAIYWLRKAADSGNALAQVLLGSHYELGNVVLKDNDEAFRLYSLAAEQGDAWGQYEVGHCYERGIGVGENMEEAIRYYTLSAAQGGVDARNALHRIKDWYGFPGHENPVYVSLAQAALENLKKENRE